MSEENKDQSVQQTFKDFGQGNDDKKTVFIDLD